jgi:hypothetical protein
MSERAALARQLAAKLLPDTRAQEAHVQATYERACEAIGRAVLRLELVAEAHDDELEDAAGVAYERMALARSALLDHLQACVSLARAWSGE